MSVLEKTDKMSKVFLGLREKEQQKRTTKKDGEKHY